MYTSSRSDSVDRYATHRPSGEKHASLSTNGVRSQTVGGWNVPSAFRFTAQRSSAVFGSFLVNSNVVPSGDQATGDSLDGPVTAGFGSPPPLADCTKMSPLPLRADWKAISLPVGDHTA